MTGNVEISTAYLGMALRSPVVASSSPLTGDLEQAIELDRAGAGAIVLPSLFEEEVLAEEEGLTAALEMGSGVHPEASGYFPPLLAVSGVAERYVEHLSRVKAAVGVPVIASLNARSTGAWARYARLLVEAGADALELNVYRVAADPSASGASREATDLALVSEVCATAGVPVAVKLSPYYSAMASFAAQVVAAGASGLVLFNRFYQPRVDLEAMQVVPQLELSSRAELGLPLRWVAILRPQLGPGTALAVTSGVQTGQDVAAAVAVGADAVMVTSELLRRGPGRLAAIESELRDWLVQRDYASLAELRGSLSQSAAGDAEAFERASYVSTLRSWSARRQPAPASRY